MAPPKSPQRYLNADCSGEPPIWTPLSSALCHLQPEPRRESCSPPEKVGKSSLPWGGARESNHVTHQSLGGKEGFLLAGVFIRDLSLEDLAADVFSQRCRINRENPAGEQRRSGTQAAGTRVCLWV